MSYLVTFFAIFEPLVGFFLAATASSGLGNSIPLDKNIFMRMAKRTASRFLSVGTV